MSSDDTYPRLYMALLAREITPESSVKYHTGLIYVPTAPPKKGKVNDAVRYHLKIVKKDKKEVWEFSPEEGIRRKTQKLKSVSCLGKVNITEAALRQKLAAIELKRDQTEWRCRHWTWEAIQMLANAGDIEAQSLNPEDLWNMQVAATDAAEADSKKPFPALDKTGRQMVNSGLFN